MWSWRILLFFLLYIVTLFLDGGCLSFLSNNGHVGSHGRSFEQRKTSILDGSDQAKQSLKRRNDDREIDITQTVREYIRKYPWFVQKVYDLIEDVQSGELAQNDTGEEPTCVNQGPDVCVSGGADWLALYESDYDVTVKSLTDMVQQAVHSFETDPESCQPCKETWSLLQTVVCLPFVRWETIRDLLIPACEESFAEMGIDPVMCNGTITLQGKHLYCIIQEASVDEFCESMNDCYPPDPRERPPVSERTPWYIKATQGLHPGTGPGERRSRDGLVMVAQLADIHVQFEHVVGSMDQCIAYICCLEDSIGQGSARQYGEYQCNVPPRTLDLFLRRVQDAQPDFIMYAGDSPPHHVWEETLTSQVNCSQLVVDAMARAFSEGMTVYPAVGNHEMFPTNLFSLRMEETKYMMDEFVMMWHRLAGFDSEANQTFGELGYYTTLVPGHPRLRVMSVNSNYDWYTVNFYNVLNQHSEENNRHKAWVEETLAAAQAKGERVIIMSHHPVGRRNTLVRTSRWWEEVVIQYHDVIILHVSGHTHFDHFKLNFDPDTMDAVSVNTVVAAISPEDHVNPTMKMFYLDPERDYELVDFESFYLDIKTQNESRGVPPTIEFSYSAADLYGLPDLSPASWKNLVLRFIDDDELFDAYYRNRYSGARDSPCDYACKVHNICRIWFPEVSESDDCETLAPPAPTVSVVPPTEQTGAAVSMHRGVVLMLFCVIVYWL